MFDISRSNICFVAGTLGQGGAERQLFYMLRALRQSGAGLRLLSLTRGEFWEEKVRELGIPIIWVGQQVSRLARLKKIISVLREQPPAILQSQHFYTNLYAVAAARRLGLREVGAIRNDGISEVRANGRFMGYLSLRAPRVLAANSQNAIRNAISLGVPASRLHLIGNVIDTDQFKPADRSNRREIRLAAVGRLVEQKRVDRFLRVVASVRRESPVEVRAMIVGEGPLRPDLHRQAHDLGLLPDVVEFKGAVSDMAEVYRQADILVLTSDWEGTPNVVLEAMASGVPVVATRVGGVPDIIQHEVTGFLADPSDEAGLARSLLALMTDPHLRRKMASGARSYVEESHSLRRLPAVLASVYEEAFS